MINDAMNEWSCFQCLMINDWSWLMINDSWLMINERLMIND